jgi:hypothetical protein
MASSDATSVEEYLAELPEDRRAAITAVRDVVLDHLPDGFVESFGFGMITYEVPLETFPDTYNGKPLMYAALANQKRHMALYLTSVYADPDRLERFREAYLATGKKLDMGKSCVRFGRLDQVPLELVGEVVGDTTLEEFIATYRASRA